MNLIICGNGFDLHHGLPTKYTDYEIFLKKNYDKIYKHFESFKYLNSLKDNKWGDLEKTLTLFTDKFLVEIYEYYYVDSHEDEKKWDTAPYDIVTPIDFIFDFTGKCLYDWLSNIDTSNIINKIDSIKSEDFYVTFNYTNLLETSYNINPSNILYLHGELNSIGPEINNCIVREKLQFGSVFNNPDEVRKELENGHDLKDFDEFISPAINNLVRYCKATSKNISNNYETLSRFLSDKDFNQVVIMGNSISSNDIKYYEKILIPKYKESKWIFCSHSSQDDKRYSSLAENYDLHYKLCHWNKI